VPGVVSLTRDIMVAGEVFKVSVSALARDWAWIRSRVRSLGGPGSTQLARSTQGERFVLWLHLVHRRRAGTGSALDAPPSAGELQAMLDAYSEFLENIPASWIGAKAARRSETGWRPFRGALSEHSKVCAIGAVRVVLGGQGRGDVETGVKGQ